MLPMDASLPVPLSIALVASWLLYTYFKPKSRYHPGPTGLPIIGSLLEINNERPWITYGEWATQYGDIVMYWVMGKPVILLGKVEHAHNLIQKRMMNYGDRPELVVAQELVTQNGWYVGTARTKHDTHRKQRRILGERLRASTLRDWAHPVEIPELHLFLQRLTQHPERFINAQPRQSSHLSHQRGYGSPIHLTSTEAILGGLFTILEASPNIATQHGLKETGTPMARGDGYALPRAITEAEGATISAAMVDTGTDTLTGTTVVFMIIFMCLPHTLKKAQAIVDGAVGRDRLPNFDDLGRIPYITAMIREAFRWRTVAPVAIPHAVVADDVYDGYFIPKGATVFALSQHIYEDEELYPDHEEFKPERFLDDHGQLNTLPHAGFGFGSRKCLGQHFAEQTLFILISSFVWAFDITAPVDGKGQKIPPSLDPMDWGAFIASPPPMDFQAVITPRSQAAVDVINRAVEGDK
ncbi:uncharacterized protein PAC_18565 [Phialocephala subalpina]|uniref:Cytochrome P450 n=1 Tax=Phialocephala subalpina TaxID=576137 RepID=A0A1L7XUH2_9HELO|nr:uncharacterized protein PAC_18565 [Phialocephala subalpina]